MAPADPGGGWDETARAFQQAIRDGKVANHGAEVYNVPGAGGTLGLSDLVSKRRGNAHQLMVMGLVMLGAIETNKSAVNLSQVTPISTLTEEDEVIVVRADSKYRTLGELMADLKRDPKSIAWAGGSAGGTDQLLVGLLAKAVGVDAKKTKYVAHDGGGEAKAAILSGSVDAGVSGVSEFADQVEAGKMRALAVSGDGAPLRLDRGRAQRQAVRRVPPQRGAPRQAARLRPGTGGLT
jgi:putative tricarboxylic transport membrane protein